ncbi:hypothetical protein B0H63DRAFT_452424 [Podospora didyma]|uniref:Azaphilone pigments biosynthesis cluster protein L N-terminal domain-containing protein n=1 Tax=Podospora didyma TaxID=330526 RepID=A0AAE0N8W4_9PEZI|nr:hypothetical protein B0H63DRAFT_452424 [Podospora didyma]
MADPLSTGASAVAFIGLALSSAKAIFDVLSATKDAPRNVEQLTDEVKQLQSILQRFSQLHLDSELTNSDDLADLATLSSGCSKDLVNFNAKLQRLGLSPDDRRIGKFWKRIKTAVTEKDMDRIRDTIRHHTSVLNGATHLEKPPAPSVDSGLEESVGRLINLIDEKDCTVESDSAEQLILDLQTLLDYAQDSKGQLKPCEGSCTADEQARAEEESDVSKELRLASRLILSAPSIIINSGGPVRVLGPMPHGVLLQQQRKQKTIGTRIGSLTVTTKNRRRKYKAGHAPSDDNRGSEWDFVAKILFRHTSSKSIISISVLQEQLPKGRLVFKIEIQMDGLFCTLRRGKTMHP